MYFPDLLTQTPNFDIIILSYYTGGKAMFEEALKAISSYRRIIIFRHKNPDGDAVGSQTGLKYIIKSNFPDKEVYAVGDDPKRYAFIDGSKPDEVPDGLFSGALAVILDSGASSLISDGRYLLAEKTLRIDHHLFSERIAEEEICDQSYESCCGMIAELAAESGLEIPKIAASALFTGMVTDSGRFRYDGTSPRTFRLAAMLCEKGIDTGKLYGKLYADDFQSIKLRAAFVLKIKFTKNNVAYIYTSEDEVKALGADAFSLSRGMVGTMADIKGVGIWVNFTESDGCVLCEIRSGEKNINSIAVKYGGGGHAKASGATLSGYDEAMKLLCDLDEMAGEKDE